MNLMKLSIFFLSTSKLLMQNVHMFLFRQGVGVGEVGAACASVDTSELISLDFNSWLEHP